MSTVKVPEEQGWGMQLMTPPTGEIFHLHTTASPIDMRDKSTWMGMQALTLRAQGIREAIAILDDTLRNLGRGPKDAKETLVLIRALMEAWAVQVEAPVRSLPIIVPEKGPMSTTPHIDPQTGDLTSTMSDVSGIYTPVSVLKVRGEWQNAYFSAPGFVPLIESLGPCVGLEIGTCSGWNAIKWLEACPNITHLDLVDPYRAYGDVNGGETQEECDAFRHVATVNLAPWSAKVTQHIMTSLELAQHGPKAPSYDFIFIDGEHTYAAVLADLHAWYYSVRPGGICGGHDFGLACVATAVSEFAKTLSYTPEIKTCQDGCWYWTIPKA